MKFGEPLRRYWPEMLLFLAVALPWLSLLVLGSVWLWQGGHVWAWSIATAVLGLLAERGPSTSCRLDRPSVNQTHSRSTA
jgi:hypothetical protein